MQAEIITIGDEILIGQITDTNSQWMARELNKIGVSVYQISSIQDDKFHILEALKEAEKRADIVLITGGLGPTKDDITKKTIAAYFQDTEITTYPKVTTHIKKMFKRFDIPYNEVQKYQAQLPSKATLLMNYLGTAPGMWFFENNTVFVSMPGVPYEMEGLMSGEILPRIQHKFRLPYIIHKTIFTYGQGESIIADRIEEWENNLPDFIKLAYLPSFGKVRLRLSAKGFDKDLLEETLKMNLTSLELLISDIITGYDENGSIEKYVGRLLKEKKLTLSIAESLTGGKIASTIVSVPGSSVYFKGGIVAYSSETKQNILGVSKSTIDKYTVVSKEVVKEMAIKVREKIESDFGISVTGNAGPTKDKTDKSVGDVYIAVASKKGVRCEHFNFGKPREKVINKTVNKALQMLHEEILKT